MSEISSKPAIPSDGKRPPFSGQIFIWLGICCVLFLSLSGCAQSRSRKASPDQEALKIDPLEDESPETADAPDENTDMIIDMPAKAEKVERIEPPAQEAQASPAPPEERLMPPPSAGSVIETVWVWQETRDCLWRLAKKHYKDPWKWKKIYLANRGSILDPNVIYPKQRIEIPSAAE